MKGYHKRVITNSPLCSPERERLMQSGQQAPGAAGSWGMPFTELSGKSSEKRSIGNSLGKFSPPEVSATEQHAGMKSAQLPHVQVAEREMEDMQGTEVWGT